MEKRTANPIDATRYPVRIGMHTTEDGEEVLLEVDELQRDHPRTFAWWCMLEPSGLEEHIDRVCLAQAYADPNRAWTDARDSLRGIPYIVQRNADMGLGTKNEEWIRDLLYFLSSAIQEAPGLVTQAHRIARARLLACMAVNEIDTEGAEDPAAMILEKPVLLIDGQDANAAAGAGGAPSADMRPRLPTPSGNAGVGSPRETP